jgi:hypothetical protein
MSDASRFASRSVAGHLARGAVGFGLISAGFGLAPAIGVAALLLAAAGLVALRGCPMCWTIGLLETISAGRLERRCAAGGCALRPVSKAPIPAPADRQAQRP